MGLSIHWSLQDGKICKIAFFDNDKQVFLSNLSPFLDSISEKHFDAPNGDYKASLHIQTGFSFFNKRDISQTNGEAISVDYSFAQDTLYYNKETTEQNEEKLPIIHFSAWPLEEDELTDDYNIHYPRYAQIMDSSIWNYFYHIRVSKNNTSDSEKHLFSILPPTNNEKDHLYWIFNNISSHYSRGLYNLVITREYADLNARLVRQSYIAGQDGHSFDVSPFLFHSEWSMEAEWKKEVKRLPQNIKWRFLLIDDHAWKSMDKDIANEKNTDIQKNSKLDILSRTISDMGLSVRRGLIYNTNNHIVFKPKEDGEFDVELWGVQTIRDAFSALSETKFDIILLDYLLGKQHSIDKDAFGKKYRLQSTREYGYQFLSRLKQGRSNENIIPKIEDGPCGKQYFMFISAFTTAVGERLRLEGLHRTEDSWYIAEGACPTNTPCLFRYYLSRIMARRLEDTGIKDLSEDNILKLAKEIYCKKEKDAAKGRISAVRERAYEAYHDILDLHHDFSLLKQDQKKSLLVKSFLANKEQMGALLEHLLQLVHLTAFGTVRQWPEIWEEYKFFTRSINVDAETLSVFSKDIEDYIIELKSV